MYKFGKRSKQRLKGVDAKLVNVLNELIKVYVHKKDKMN